MKTGPRAKAAIEFRQIDLNSLFVDFTSPADREAKRTSIRAETRRQHPGPLTGAWYWVPVPTGRGRLKWEIQAFFDCWGSVSDHVQIWRHVLDSLRHHWQRPLRGLDYCSLPRGRVAAPIVPGQYGKRPRAAAIYHGNDSPLGPRGVARVRAVFNLTAAAPAIFDEHEQCIAGQPEALSRALGIELRITGVGISDLDYND